MYAALSLSCNLHLNLNVGHWGARCQGPDRVLKSAHLVSLIAIIMNFFDRWLVCVGGLGVHGMGWGGQAR